MYIRKSIRSYKGRSYVNYILVESVHTAKGPRQKTVCSLGDLGARPAAEWLKLASKIEDALVGQGDLLDTDDAEVAEIARRVRMRRSRHEAPQQEPPPASSTAKSSSRRGSSRALIKVDPARVATERHREAGPVHVGYQFWQRLELECARNPKAKRGYSRDHRGDCKQVIVALVINRDGFAITHEVFAGNTQDRATLATMLDLLAARAGLTEGATVVVDRGMAFDENIAEIKRRKLHYVVAARQPERDRWLADFEDVDGFVPVVRQPSPLNEAQKKTTIEVQTRRDGEQTYVLCRSEQRIAKDRAIRAKQENRLRADIEALATRIEQRRLVKPAKINQAIGRLKERYPRVARYFDLSYDPRTRTLAAPLNAAKYATAEQLDGCYLIKTDRTDLSGDELLRIYLLLTRAENAFRDIKSPLAERPIFHHTERRTEAHIFLCVLAYHLLIAIEKMLLDRAIHTSWATVRDTLKSHQICTVVLPSDDGSILRIRKAATPEPEVEDLYRSLGIAPQIIKPHHSMIPPHSD